MPKNSKSNKKLPEPSGCFSTRGAHPEARRAEGSKEILPRPARQDEGSKNAKNSPTHQLPIVTGIVVSDKMEKTIVVRLDSITRHPVYKKVIKRPRKVKAHDEKNAAKTGDVVKIGLSRPLSKDKRWKLMEVVKK